MFLDLSIKEKRAFPKPDFVSFLSIYLSKLLNYSANLDLRNLFLKAYLNGHLPKHNLLTCNNFAEQASRAGDRRLSEESQPFSY